jgi:hypothetical protein
LYIRHYNVTAGRLNKEFPVRRATMPRFRPSLELGVDPSVAFTNIVSRDSNGPEDPPSSHEEADASPDMMTAPPTPAVIQQEVQHEAQPSTETSPVKVSPKAAKEVEKTPGKGKKKTKQPVLTKEDIARYSEERKTKKKEKRRVRRVEERRAAKEGVTGEMGTEEPSGEQEAEPIAEEKAEDATAVKHGGEEPAEEKGEENPAGEKEDQEQQTRGESVDDLAAGQDDKSRQESNPGWRSRLRVRRRSP